MANVTDQLQRPIRDLRISVTDRCNFRCTYCMPKEVFGDDFVFLPKNELLTFEEIERLARIFADLGVKKYRITGGEPLLRRNLPELIMKLNEIESIEDIGMTTNAILLPRHAHDLYAAGLRRLNISLDALNSDVFGKMNGRGMTVDRVLDAIDLARDIGFYVKVNMVVEKGVNEHEVIPMANYFKERQIPLRFIEFMDVGNDNRWDFKKVVSMKEILTQLQSLFSLEPITATYYGEVAKRYRYTDNGAEVGFISSVSASFCSTCTRARLSSEGKLYTCLFASEGFSLKELLRNGETDQQIKNAIRAVWEKRTDRYSDERAIRMNQRSKINMNYIGG